jgi:lipoprotein-anchoring transpeptidase ErfK/SrfK
MRAPSILLSAALAVAALGLPAQAAESVALRFVEAAADQPVATLAVRTVEGATTLALIQDGKELQRYAPPAQSAEGLIPVKLEPGSGSITLTARAYDAQGQVLGESAPVSVDPRAFAPEPLASATENNRVTDRLNAVTLSSLTPAVPADGHPGATLKVTLNGDQVHQSFLPRHGHLTLPDLSLPLGRNDLRIEQRNAWGTREVAAVRAFNLGETIPASTYILVDKENYSLYWVQNGVLAGIYPIATGRPRTPTPVGTFVLGKKETMAYANTGWGVLRMLIYDVGRGGRRHWGGYAIHGTNQPSSIGKEASHGCVRMFNADVLSLSKVVPLETRVVIRPKLKVYIDEL